VHEHTVRSRGLYIAYSKYAGHMHLSDGLGTDHRCAVRHILAIYRSSY